MGKLISIGELLIDFTGGGAGKLGSVSAFEKHPGGAPACFKNSPSVFAGAFPAKQADTTGAGDAFVGTLLFQLLRGRKKPETLANSPSDFKEYISAANRAAALSVSRRGAISSMPNCDEVFAPADCSAAGATAHAD